LFGSENQTTSTNLFGSNSEVTNKSDSLFPQSENKESKEAKEIKEQE
jgi:hypothetical protein